MKRRIKILVGCLLLLVLGTGLGHLLNVPITLGGVSQFQQSPDGKWIAYADTLDETSWLGPRRTYSQLTIQPTTPSPRPVRSMRIEDTTVPSIDWREEGRVFWTSNSSAVTFKCDTQMTGLEITLKIEP